jgi:hypothetical protein
MDQRHDSALADISSIQGLVARTRSRLRAQAALEAATTAVVPASAVALAAVFLIRTERVTTGAGVGLLVLAAAIIAGAAIAAALRRHDDELVARRIDRASGLADRLSTAIAFQRLLDREGGPGVVIDGDAETHDLMAAAIRDAVRVAPRANIALAAPYRQPRDLKVAAGFAIVAALTAGLALPQDQLAPRLLAAVPAQAPPGGAVVLQGANLLRGDRATRSVYLGKGAQALPVEVTAWRADAIELRLPENAPLGATTLTAYLGQRAVGPLAFTVVDPKDATFHEEDAVALEEDDLDYVRDLLHDLKAVAKTDDAQALDEFAAKLEKLLEQAEKGELTKEQLLAKVDEAFEELSKGATPDPSEVNKDLQETGKELAKQEVTQELGRALEQGDLQKAKEELEKLAEKLDKNELSPEQKEQVAQAMDKAAEAFEKKEQQRDQKQAQQQQKLEEEKRTLEKKKEQAKNDQEREELERRLEKNKRELKQLEKEKQEREGSEQKRALKRLHKDMQKAAKEMQKKPQDQQEQQQQDQQASRNLRDVARETGRVDQDQRKQAAQKKVASQMEDLREALRRAKRRGSKGPSDPFGKSKQSDFRRRAQGQTGSRQAWKPGQGQPGKGQQGQGQNGQGQQGQGQNGQGQQGDSYGDEHDPNIVGDATGKSGDTKDESLSGVHGKGPSRRETILAAAQKGFASRSYQQVFADYKTIVEEVMRAEKVPASKKFYVKKYFNNIKPHSVSPGADGE